METLPGGKTIAQWKKEFPLLEEAASLREVFWVNPLYRGGNPEGCGIHPADMDAAADRLARFAPFIARAWPETAKAGGIIESPLKEVPRMRDFLRALRPPEAAAAADIPGRLLVKCDSHLPVSGSIKARGGIYEVLSHAEKLALEEGLLKPGDNYEVFCESRFREFFRGRQLAVGSTGNLGLSIGIAGAKLGFTTTVHLSADARPWKKALLRDKGVQVIEYDADYSTAVAAGRAHAGPNCYFVDDENSRGLFLGYSTAALRLQKQLEALRVRVDEEHPLFVYLPCGVGGGPGGVSYGLKRLYGGAVHVFFVEPTHAPCMLLGLVTGLQDKVCVGDFGIDNKTCADGLAVGRPSRLASGVMKTLLSGEYTIADEMLYRLLFRLADLEDLWIEPSAAAGCLGPVWIHARAGGKAYLEKQLLPGADKKITHLVWLTGGAMVPEEEMKNFYLKGKKLSEEACYQYLA
jgi:D-serine dehydratase